MAHRTRPLHVSVITPLGPGGKGGIDRQMDALTAMLRERSGEALAITVHKTRGEGPLFLSIGLVAQAMASLAWRKATGRVDIAHINLAHSGSIYRKAALGKWCHLLGIPYVVHLHGSRFRQTWNGAAPWLSRAMRAFFERSAATLVLGKVWADFISERAPAAGSRMFVTPSSAADHPQSDGSGSAVLNILFMGRLGARKGVPQLVEALKLLETEANWRADLAGDGEIDETRAKVQALGLSERVTVPGWTSGAAHESLFRAADILVLPSLDENLPMTIVEAFSRSVAVVSTPVGAIPDIVIPGRSGMLVAPGEAPALAEAIRALLRDQALRARLAAGGRQIFEERLDLSAYAENIAAIWRRAAGRDPAN